MKRIFLVLPVLGLGLGLPAAGQNAPGKVGVINFQSAIVSTRDGQKAAGDIQTRFTPKKTELEKRQTDINQLQDQLNRGRNTLSPEAQQKLVRDIDQKTKSLNRDTQDAQEELNQEEQRIMNELGSKILAVMQKYANDNGFTLILDDSAPQSPVLWASNAIDITREIIELYDKNAPATTSAPPASAQPPARMPSVKPVVPPKPAPPK